MSEHVFAHYRTGTFPVTVTGIEGQSVVEARWVRDHHVIHLFVPQIEGTASGVVELGAFPGHLRPSRREVFAVPVRSGSMDGVGLLACTLGGLRVEGQTGAVRIGPCAVHYLSIPGQMEDAAGVMQRVPEGDTLPEPEPRPEPEPEPEPPYRGTGQAEPAPAAEGEPTYA